MDSFVPVLSYGMGVESTAILLRYLTEPSIRDFRIEDLIVITAQTGNEWIDTKRDVEGHVLPRLRETSVRLVQVARAGHLEREGIVVLSDCRDPQDCLIGGAYKLSQELQEAGTVPQYGGEHRCSLKFKAFVIERWLEENVTGQIRHSFGFSAEEIGRVRKSDAAIAARVTFGFNSDEAGRVLQAQSYDRPERIGHYPLVEWGWNRARCLDYIRSITGIEWNKSACASMCPFAVVNQNMIDRQKLFPAQVADAMLLERSSLAMNPRGQLYKSKPLYGIVRDSENRAAEYGFERKLSDVTWAVYRVRRIYSAKGKAQRCVERIKDFASQTKAVLDLQGLIAANGLDASHAHGLTYGYCAHRGDDYPTTEEYFVAAPALAGTKARYGVNHFEKRWQQLANLYCGHDDLPLFSEANSEK